MREGRIIAGIVLLLAAAITSVAAFVPPPPKPGTPVRGTVVDRDGKPMAGVAVVLQRPLRWTEADRSSWLPWHSDPRVESRRSDRDGRFSFAEPVPPGLWTVDAKANDPTAPAVRRTGPDRVDVPDRSEPFALEVRLRCVEPIRGTVTDLDGHPLDEIVDVGAGRGIGMPALDGKFELLPDDGDPDVVTITAGPTATHDKAESAPVPWGTNDVRLALPPATTVPVDVTVVDAETGRPVPDYTLEARPAHGRGFALDYTPVNDDAGHTVLHGLRPGPTRFTVRPEDTVFERAMRIVDLVAPATLPLRIEVARRRVVSVRVVDEAGRPRPDVTLEADPLPLLEADARAKTDENGIARLPIAHGATVVDLFATLDDSTSADGEGRASIERQTKREDHAFAWTRSLTPFPDTFTITLPRGHGHVHGTVHPAPGEHWTLGLAPADYAVHRAQAWSRLLRVAPVRADGTFALSAPVGAWNVFLLFEDTPFDLDRTIDVEDGGDVALELPAPSAGTGTLAGQVLGPPEAVPLEVLLIGDVGALGPYQRRVLLDASGRFTAAALPAGTYRVGSASGWPAPMAISTDAVPVTPGTTAHGAFRPRRVPVRLTLRDAAGAPFEDASFLVNVGAMTAGAGILVTGGTVDVDVPPQPFWLVVLDMDSNRKWRSDRIDPADAADGLAPALHPWTEPLW